MVVEQTLLFVLQLWHSWRWLEQLKLARYYRIDRHLFHHLSDSEGIDDNRTNFCCSCDIFGIHQEHTTIPIYFQPLGQPNFSAIDQVRFVKQCRRIGWWSSCWWRSFNVWWILEAFVLSSILLASWDPCGGRCFQFLCTIKKRCDSHP